MNIEKLIRARRITCRRIGYIPPLPDGEYITVDDCRGTHPLDDFDNGDLPDLTTANFYNTGKPTYMLSTLTSIPMAQRRKKVSATILSRFSGMMTRCYSRNYPGYKRYGGRGIKVCDAWHTKNPNGRDNYNMLFAEGLLSNPGLEIDRKDNDGNYCPDNCRLVTPQVNTQNTRSVTLTDDDVISLRKEYKQLNYRTSRNWLVATAKAYNVDNSTISNVVFGKHWSNMDCIEQPAIKYNKTDNDLWFDGLVIQYNDILTDNNVGVVDFLSNVDNPLSLSPAQLLRGFRQARSRSSHVMVQMVKIGNSLFKTRKEAAKALGVGSKTITKRIKSIYCNDYTMVTV